MSQRPRDRVPSGSMLALPDPRRPDRENPPKNFSSLLFPAVPCMSCSSYLNGLEVPAVVYGYPRKKWTRVQILDETDCISHSTNTLRKGMNPIISFQLWVNCRTD